METNNIHIPVLLKEILQSLDPVNNPGTYCDFTIGYGGHASAIWKQLDQTKSKYIGFDRDPVAYEWCLNNLSIKPLQLVNDNFVNFKKYFHQWRIKEVNGALLDLGVSSKQLDDPSRGFSYHHDGPFDMRMNQGIGLSATEFVLKTPLPKLIKIFKEYGEIKNPVHIALLIKKYVEKNKEQTTTIAIDELIKQNLPVKQLYEKKHPSRLYFQALRIAVNDELLSLSKFLNEFPTYLAKNAVLCVITFHSLEEKIVKTCFRKLVNTPPLMGVPINPVNLNQFELVTNKAITASEAELQTNRRSRSAKLFVLKKKE
ncbi:16S rRNA (cytosine(1402)-N(4))-methyltransferase RsmH [[Mycoplasma] testudinis]|uniref:16S rRNA (cytosine(1402)-N(4))-methyltransferase RsmH n=1 Tax=[Mycoplasma] testudinis TaxID=33924 RepID=UPI000483B7B1|nr:16S rRNA (cytosine(1402)-N(4))-methyltransferase RsmH [[Mycoplasma] testudinis]